MSVISLDRVSFRYPGQKHDALSDVSLEIRKGEFLLILGGDGSGKSTLCKALNGLIPGEVKGDFAGEVLVNGKSTRSIQRSELVRTIGLALQDPEVQLFTDSVEEEVAFGPENLAMSVAEIDARVGRALEMTGLSALRKKSPSALSGGQKQRLAIAAVLSMSPEVLILDEPMSMLDPRGRVELLAILDTMRKERGMTVVLTSQEPEEVLSHCDRIALLKKGRLIGLGSPSDILGSAEKLASIDVEPPQLLALSDYLIQQRLLDESGRFIDEDGAVRNLSALLRARRAAH